MTPEAMQASIESHDRQLDTVIGLLASLAERINGLVRVAELQHERLVRLENGSGKR